jgi:hypothetical protein
MAGIFSIGKTSAAVAVTGGGILGELSATTSNRVKVREIGVFLNSAAGGAVTVAVGRPGNTPTTGTAALGVAEDMVDTQTALASLITAGWAVAPTVPTLIYRQITLPATIGAGVIWTWPPGEELALGLTRNLGLAIWVTAQTIAASQTCSIHARWTE